MSAIVDLLHQLADAEWRTPVSRSVEAMRAAADEIVRLNAIIAAADRSHPDPKR